MPIERDAALRTAEKLLRQGKLAAAIEQYVRLIEEDPHDWNAINTLGDLYARAGDTDRALTQFLHVADHLYSESVFPKADAAYKKALKVGPDNEHTLSRLAESAVQQGLVSDGKAYLRRLAQQRQDRGDAKGAAECLIRVGSLDEDDGDAKLAAARAATTLGDAAQAVTFFKSAAAAYDKQGRAPDALEARIAVVGLCPDDHELRATVARALIDAGQLDRAHEFLTAATAGDDPDLLIVVGRGELLAGRSAEGHALLMRAVALGPDRQDSIVRLADELLAADRVEDAYGCVEILVDAALFEGAFDRAADTLQSFLGRRRTIPALLKLVDVCVDAGFDNRLPAVQAQLADAYLDTGLASEARVVAEDLIIREPRVEAHVQRLRRALVALGVDNTEDAIAHQLKSAAILAAPLGLPKTDRPAMMGPADPERPGVPAPIIDRSRDGRGARALEAFEIDLSDTLAGLNAPVTTTKPVVVHEVSVEPAEPSEPASPPDLEVEVEVASRPEPEEDDVAAIDPADAAALFEQAQEYLRNGMAAEGAAALQAAANVPQVRFKAAAQLGRLSLARGDLRGGVEWLERAASAESPSMGETYEVLYDLADSLDRAGEPARALAVFIKLETQAFTYRDVHARIQFLSKYAAESRPGGESS